jgi:exodeoxyribonuclease VII small subunit
MEQIVRQLEDGNLSLDDSLALFERGQALSVRCQQLLENAELKVQQLAPKTGGYGLQTFDEDER